MRKWKLCTDLEMSSDRRLQYILLLAVGVIEFMLITMEGLCGYLGYYLAETYLVVPGLVFLGIALTQNLNRAAKQQLGLAAFAVCWFIAVQIHHRMIQMETYTFGMFFFAWLMAFPFAAVTEDEGNRGFRLIAKMFLAASLILVFYTVLLILDMLPGFLQPFVFWDGTRLHAMWHPNTTACIFMIGIGFSLYFLFQAKTVQGKAALLAAVALQFLAMALTNCRTSILMTCAFLGGVVFFVLWKDGWKRFLIGVVAALTVMAALFVVSSNLYELSTEMQTAKLTALLQEQQEREAAAQTVPMETEASEVVESEAATEATEIVEEETTATEEIKITQNYLVNSETGEVTIYGASGQGTLSNDMKTLNGRTWIWTAAFNAIRDQKSLLLWGTEYAGVTISVYNRFPVEHAHNSWVEVLLRLGLPGLLTALAVTWIAVRSALVLLLKKQVDMGKKAVAILVLCVMVASFLEPYLFITRNYYQFIDFIFFFCVGYLDQWRRQLS